MSTLIFVRDRFTKCDSGETLNWLMHPFLFMTLFLSVGFLFFEDTKSVQQLVIYQQTSAGNGISMWGVIGLAAMTLHTAGFLIRGKYGIRMMQFALFGASYLWIWAGIVYITDNYFFQFVVFCLPNLWFWGWYAWQWKKRDRGDRVAFV